MIRLLYGVAISDPGPFRAVLATAGEAHLDVAGAMFLAASALLLIEGRGFASALAFAMAVAIKPLPIVLLPL